MRGDRTACVVVIRERRSHDWSFMINTENVATALKSAELTRQQEHTLGNTRFEAKVMKRKDWDAKKFRARITEQA